MWAALNCAGRGENDFAPCIQQKPGIHKLIWKECVVGIREDRLETNCSRSDIHLIIDSRQGSGRNSAFEIAIEHLHRHPLPRAQFPEHGRQTILRNVENYRDRLQLCNHRKTGLIAGMDNVAGIDLA